MYQQYDELSMRILGAAIEGNKRKSTISITRTTINKFRQYMQANGLSYSPEIAAEWLDSEMRPICSHPVYTQRCNIQYRIASLFKPEANLKELFYKDLQSDFDRLPFWAQDVVLGFLSYYRSRQKCIALFKAGASTFLFRQVKDGLLSISDLSHEQCASYYREHGPKTGVARFLTYLDDQRMIGPFVRYGYHYAFAKRIFSIPSDSVLRGNIANCGLEEYRAAQSKVYKSMNSQGYSTTLLKSFLSVSNEYGLFLGLNRLGHSRETVDVFIANFESNISKRIDTVRRSLLVIDHLLSGGAVDSIPLVFPKSQRRGFPSWAQSMACEFLALRIRSGKCASTLTMDRSAITRFLAFVDSQGCRNFNDVTVELIKGFNLQDWHATGEGKNAYNARIRGFLRFLENQDMIPNGISKALPTANGVKLRPAVILGSDDLQKIDSYIVNAEREGKWLESTVLKIATQTGLRGIDISRLRCDSIDWKNREFSLIQRKTKKHIRLPFSNGVGNSMLKYIEEERPLIDTPFLFISPRAPHGCLSRSQVNLIVSRALGRRAGVHILRKTFASGLLRADVSYVAVADALGHENSKAVDPYLSMDSERMRACAIPLDDGLQCKGVSL